MLVVIPAQAGIHACPAKAGIQPYTLPAVRSTLFFFFLAFPDNPDHNRTNKCGNPNETRKLCGNNISVVRQKGTPMGILGEAAGAVYLTKEGQSWWTRLKRVRPKWVGLIVAAGESRRWRQSLQKDNKGRYQNLNQIQKRLRRLGEKPIELPSHDQGSHKSCALLNGIPVFAYSFLSYWNWGIKDLLVVVNARSRARREIERHIDFCNALTELNIGIVPVTERGDTAHSVYVGLQALASYRGEVVVSYSDIVWEERLMRELLRANKGDVVILADSNWRALNYPPRRIWHDMRYAELVFEDEGAIERIGEPIRRFTDMPRDLPGAKRALNIVCRDDSKEVVGLFKFSKRACDLFREAYGEILNLSSPPREVPIVQWRPPYVPEGLGLKPKSGRVAISKALLGCFLEYLARRPMNNLDVKVLALKGGWVEIDHWGDLCIALERIHSRGPSSVRFERRVGELKMERL